MVDPAGVGLAAFLVLRDRLRGDKCGEFPDCTEDDELSWTGSPCDKSLGDLFLDAIARVMV